MSEFRLLWLAPFWLLASGLAFGQFGLRFQHIETGLSESVAKTIVQDRQGFLWIGTQDGLNRYDGYTFSHFKHDPSDAHSISDNNVYVLALDRDGSLWVGTDGGGLNHFDPATETFVAFRNSSDPKSLSNDDIRAIRRDSSNQLWIGTDQGLNLMKADGQFQRFAITPELGAEANRITTLLQEISGKLLVGTMNGLYAFVDGSFVPFVLDPDGTHPLRNRIHALMEDRAGFLWAGTEGGLMRLARTGSDHLVYQRAPQQPGSLADDWVTDLLEDSAGKLWVGTNQGGLNLYNREKQIFEVYQNRPEDSDSLSNNLVHALYEDRSGVLWIGTHSGLNKYHHQLEVFSWYRQVANDPRGLGGRLVWAIYQDRADDLWVGTNNGLTLYRGGEVVHYRHEPGKPHSLSHDEVRDIYEDRSGRIWIATRGGGLNRFDRASQRFQHYLPVAGKPDSFSHPFAWRIYEDRLGNIWIGTAGGGLERYHPESDSFSHLRNEPTNPDSLANDQVSALFEDDKEELWVGTFGGGLDRFDRASATFQHYRHSQEDSNSLNHDRVLSIYQAEDGGPLWIGTWGGLSRLDSDRNRFHAYREKDGLPSEVVYGILGDDNGMLWMSTNKGLCQFDPKEESFRVFTVGDGIQSDEFNSGAYFRAQDGRLFFGGIDGLTAFYPQNVRKDPRAPQVVITAFLRDNHALDLRAKDLNSPLVRAINQTQRLELDYHHGLIAFEFAGLHYAAPEKNKYAYRLLGFSENWIETDAARRYATFTDLDYGHYRFQVKAANKDGIWSEEFPTLELVIHPPIYLTPWAQACYFLIVVALIGLVSWLYRRKIANERRVRDTIRQSEERLKFALWGSGDEHWDWDLTTGTIYRSNQSGLLAFHEEQKEMSIALLQPMVHPKDFPRLQQAWSDHLAGRTPYFECTYRVVGTRQDWVWILDRGKVVGRDEHGKATRVSGTIKDISKLKETEDKLRLIAIAFENTSDGVFITDADLILVAVNQAYSRITGKTSEEVLGRPFRIARIDNQDDAFAEKIMTQLQSEGQWHGELVEQRKNRERYQQELLLDLVRDEDGETCYYVGVFSDISFRKKAESELRHLANYDKLTNLPNRTLFAEHLDQSILEATRTSGRFAVLFIDLDNFKNINDSLGHTIGDLLLVAVGKRLSECIRAEDVVARFGGDEFSMLLKEVRQAHGAAKVAEKLLGTLAQPFDLEGHNIVISPSIGIVLFPNDGHRPEELLRNADTAMYHAKSRGKNNYQFFTDEMNQRVLKRLKMEADLRMAIDERELILYYQPKVNLESGAIVGMEALVRWQSPKHGFVNPGQFISVAEETGLVVPMGKQVLEIACRQSRQLVDHGLLRGRVAVNLSALQFRQKDLLKFVANTLAETGLAPSCLELEITEGTLMENADYAIEVMQGLRDLGITLAIDDFGTGFSSLSYLKRFPVTSLKVDRSFVVDMAVREDDHMIVASIVGLAHNLGIKVVAEGVENFDQVNSLKDMGCKEMQGFLFSKPLPFKAFEEMLREGANLYVNRD